MADIVQYELELDNNKFNEDIKITILLFLHDWLNNCLIYFSLIYVPVYINTSMQVLHNENPSSNSFFGGTLKNNTRNKC